MRDDRARHAHRLHRRPHQEHARRIARLRMPRALEIVDAVVSQIERGEATALEAVDLLLTEELTLRESRRIKTALVMARISTLKTLSGFDFAFQPSLDRGAPSRVLGHASGRRCPQFSRWPSP